MRKKILLNALGKAICLFIEPEEASMRPDGKIEIKSTPANRFKQTAKTGPQYFKLNDESNVELGEFFLKLLSDEDAVPDFSRALLQDVHTVIKGTNNNLAGLAKAIHESMQQIFWNETFDLVVADACDFLNPVRPPEKTFRQQTIKLVEDMGKSILKHGPVILAMKINPDDHSQRLASPDAWATQYAHQYRSKILFAGFHTVFAGYGISLNEYTKMYSPMSPQQIDAGNAKVIEYFHLAEWVKSLLIFKQAIKDKDLYTALRFIIFMAPKENAGHYAEHQACRAELDTLFEEKIARQVEIFDKTQTRAMSDPLKVKVFKSLSLFKMIPPIQAEYDKILAEEKAHTPTMTL
jgi:hypothetical protein